MHFLRPMSLLVACTALFAASPSNAVEKWTDYQPPAPGCGDAALELALGENGCVNLTGRLRLVVGYDSQSGAMPIFQGFARGTVVADDALGLAVVFGGHVQRVNQPDWFYGNEAALTEAFVSIGHENFVRAGYFDAIDSMLPRNSELKWLTEVHAVGFDYAYNLHPDGGLGIQGGFALAPGFSIFGAAEGLDRDRKQFIAGAEAENDVLYAKLTVALVDDDADPAHSGSIAKGIVTADFGALDLQGGVSVDTTKDWEWWHLYGAAKVQHDMVFATVFGTMSDYYTEVGGAVGLGVAGETPTIELGGQYVMSQWSEDVMYGWIVATVESAENVSFKGKLVYSDISFIDPFWGGGVEALWQPTPHTQIVGAYEANTLGAIKATASVEQRF